MSINYAVLGILSYEPMTGYDLKKIIQESPFMYWSGNSNQIYKALVELSDKGFVTNEVRHQESLPSKKIYTITKEGLEALKDWVLSSPEPCEFKKPFLVQLAWSKQLNSNELDALLTDYENQIKMQMMIQQDSKQKMIFSPKRTLLEATVWDLIHENITLSYTNELKWIQNVRDIISGIENEADRVNHIDMEVAQNGKEDLKMEYVFMDKGAVKYIHFTFAETPLCTENVSDIISICVENNTNFVLFDSEALSDEFFNLRTGVAGAVLQKFTMYRIKAAAVITDQQRIKGKFKNMLAENNKRGDFRSFESIIDAENWFLTIK
ncbi:DUF4180 domain-containing protein [Paenibacillus popilliae]|uniref:Predicted transcriptional regulators n=1 Tax=Paenibacillus popilliae ATCC 14706 TaxID=1212764 RepID=M9LXV9_PAEPP|nr:DUF4180 domain-containing protein [Paenibacillus popilliae]GAC40884.1 predicted transcriptional regulators [Paenibacillus popilliae ATCC 14706]